MRCVGGGARVVVDTSQIYDSGRGGGNIFSRFGRLKIDLLDGADVRDMNGRTGGSINGTSPEPGSGSLRATLGRGALNVRL